MSKGDVKICQERCQVRGATHILFSLAERKWGGILGKQSPGRWELVLCMWESVTREGDATNTSVGNW